MRSLPLVIITLAFLFAITIDLPSAPAAPTQLEQRLTEIDAKYAPGVPLNPPGNRDGTDEPLVRATRHEAERYDAWLASAAPTSCVRGADGVVRCGGGGVSRVSRAAGGCANGQCGVARRAVSRGGLLRRLWGR